MEITNKKLIYTLATAILFLLIISTVVYSLIKNGVFADTTHNYYDQIKTNYDLDGDGKQEQINVNVERKADQLTFFVEIVKNRKQLLKLDLTGFESNISFCPDPVIELDAKKTICIQGFVGAHSQNLQLIQYTADALRIVSFSQSGKLLENIVTDAPNYAFERTGSLISGISLDNRNYSKNPVVDIIRSHYYLSNGVLTLGKEEELKMAEPIEVNSTGRIN